jgi:YD repeat-containing protein
MNVVKLKAVLLAIGMLALFCCPSVGRAQYDGTYAAMIGDPPNEHALPVRFGQVNLQTGSIHLEIPLYSQPERGGSSYEAKLIYDSDNWDMTTNLTLGVTGVSPYTTYYYPRNTGWTIQAGDSRGGGQVQAMSISGSACPSGDTGYLITAQSFAIVDSHGTQHMINITGSGQKNECVYKGTTTVDTSAAAAYPGSQGYATDGTGYRLTVAGYGTGVVTAIAPDGTVWSGSIPNIVPTAYNSFPYYPSFVTIPLNAETSNGNLYGYNGTSPVASSTITSNGSVLGYSSSPNVDICGQYSRTITSGSQIVDYENALQNSTASHSYSLYQTTTCTVSLPASGGLPYTFAYEYLPVCGNNPASPTSSNPAYQFCGGMWLLTSVKLPGTLGDYQFGYDTGTTPIHYGLLTSITLPTGGTVSYEYGNYAPGTLPFQGISSIQDNGGTTTIAGSQDRDYPAKLFPVTVTYPPHPLSPGSNNMTQDSEVISVNYIESSSSSNYMAVQSYTTRIYSGANLLRTTVESVDLTGRPTSVTSTWAATAESHTVNYTYQTPSPSPTKYYDSNYFGNNIIQKDEYDSGVLVRSLKTQYLGDTSSIAYKSRYNMTSLPTSHTLTDGSGNVVAQTLYAYDEYSSSYCGQAYPVGMSGIPMLASVTGASGHDDKRGTSFFARGNVTSVSRMVSPGNFIATHYCYDTLGNQVQAIDGNNNATRYSYKDTYSDAACIASGAVTYAFPTVATNALGYQAKTSYYTCSGKPGQIQDPNDLAASRMGTVLGYTVDGRINSIVTADGGGGTWQYPTPNEVDQTTSVTATTSHATSTSLDGYGRVISVNDSSAGRETDTYYDQLGHVNCVSNPHYTDVSSTDGQTCYAYDALSRVTGVQYPDKSQSTSAWTGNSVTTTDPSGIQKMMKTDALGRLTNVLEPNGASKLATNVTNYTYDLQNNLVSVSQWGSSASSSSARNRSFTYDALSRLLSATNPETRTVTYSYDNNGNVLSTTDARSITTSYTYDSLNRVLSKSYPNDPSHTPLSCSQYDASAMNGIGRLANTWTQRASSSSTTCSAAGAFLTKRSILAYDAMGRVSSEQQFTLANQASGTSYSPLYTYDLAGDLTSSTDGITPAPASSTSPPPCASIAGGTLTFVNCYDTAGRLQSLNSNWNDQGTHPPVLFSTPTYAAHGGLTGATYGNGLVLSRTYDNRLRITGEADTGSLVTSPTSGSAAVTITGAEQSR